LGCFIFSDIITYLLISLVISTLLKPLVQFFSYISFFKIRLPLSISVLFSMLILLGFIGGFILVFIPLILEQIDVLTQLNYNELLYSFDTPLRKIERFLIRNKVVSERTGFLRKQLQITNLFNVKTVYVSSLLNFLIQVFKNVSISILAVGFMTYFLLYERGILQKTFLRFMPNKYFELTLGAMFKIERLLTNYLTGLLIQLTSIFVFTAIGLSILQIPYALTIALFAAIVNLIPYLGPLIGGAFSIIVGVSTSGSLSSPDQYFWLAIKILAVTSTVHVIDNIITQPIIFSRSVKAHPMEIFVAIFAGAAIADIVGMILAIPVYTIIRVIYKEITQGYEQYRIFGIKKF
jgi:predicted PurR-regulated permease PerM